jgi:hypothetical protein
MAFARQAGRHAKARQTHSAARGSHKDVAGPKVPVNEPPRVHPADRGRKSDGDHQTLGHSHRTIEPSLERLATRVLEHQIKATLAPNKPDRPNCPLRVEVGAESVFML